MPDSHRSPQKVRKAVIPAAGLGTRFLPATKAQPKEMLPVVDKPAIQYVVEEAVRAGIRDILIITGRGKRSLEDHFDRSFELEHYLEAAGKFELLKEMREIVDMADIHYVRQGEPRGLGHAVSVAREHVSGEPFVVLLGDDIMSAESTVLSDMLGVYDRYQSSVVALKKFPLENISSYGCVRYQDVEKDPGPSGPLSGDPGPSGPLSGDPGPSGPLSGDPGPSGPLSGDLVRVLDIVEKPAPEEAPSDLAVMGRYVLTPEIFDVLDDVAPGAGGEIQLTDAMARLLYDQAIYGHVFEKGRFDVGDKLDYLRATVELALDRGDLGPKFRSFLAELVQRKGLA